jgi:hypothetical protein
MNNIKKPTVKEKVKAFQTYTEKLSEGTVGFEGDPPTHIRITCPECGSGGPHRRNQRTETDRAICNRCGHAIHI